MADGAG
ncbi:hypothetical protein YPPY101_2072, partial [Yersinia pestis PY-101]